MFGFVAAITERTSPMELAWQAPVPVCSLLTVVVVEEVVHVRGDGEVVEVVVHGVGLVVVVVRVELVHLEDGLGRRRLRRLHHGRRLVERGDERALERLHRLGFDHLDDGGGRVRRRRERVRGVVVLAGLLRTWIEGSGGKKRALVFVYAGTCARLSGATIYVEMGKVNTS